MDFSIYFCTYLFLFLLVPCFSRSCFHRFPCNQSIEIKPPFFYSNNETSPESCNNSKIKTSCVDNTPTVYPFNNNNSLGLQIQSISYQNNTIVIREPVVAQSLLRLSCDNFVFNFSEFKFNNYSFYLYLNTIISTFKCGDPDQVSLNQTQIQYEKRHHDCSSPKNASLEWTLSFSNKSENIFLLLARFSNDLSECFARGKDTGKTTRTIIAAVSGVSLFVISCFCILLYFKRKKWKWVSSSSKLLINKNRDLSYTTDLEFAGSQNTQIFTYEELEEATDSFKNELGDGGFGTVYKGKLRDGRIVAVKRLYKNSYKRVEQFMNEVEILSNLRHPNLVTLYGCTARTSHELLLVYEYIPNGTVADHLHGPRVGDHSLSWPLRLNIAIETAQALTFLHSIEPQIIHRDVKTNNILLDEGFHVKVGDFGLSRLFPLDVTHVSTVPQGTPGYVDPVYHQCYQLTEKSDVYSFGVVLIELISSKPAVDMSRSSNEINLANLALNKIQRSELSELVDPKFEYEKDWEMRRMVSLVAELAFRCLQGEREMRPTIKEALEVLLVVQKEGFGNKNKGDKDNNGEKVKEESETCLLRDGTVYSPDTVVERWTSRTTTPNTSV